MWKGALLAVAAGGLAAGCFSPTLPVVACGDNGECPDGLQCNFDEMLCGVPDSDSQDPSGDPAAPDAGNEAIEPCSRWNHDPRFFDPCAIPDPGPPVVLGDVEWTLNTDARTLTSNLGESVTLSAALVPQSGGGEMFLMSTERFELSGGSVHVIGNRPLVIASWSTLTVNGVIDASSVRGGQLGAGANPARCATHAASPGVSQSNATDNGGGGGGGGFGSPGGNGGFGGSTQAPAGPGGAATTNLSIVGGGCPGGNGGGDIGADAGNGGGAVVLTAIESIQFTGGELRANGAGGVGADSKSGGGGGGSGGLIALDAPQIVLANGILAANGGGGGEGADQDSGNDGANGENTLSPARGGTGNNGGDGGNGGARDNLSGGNGGGNDNGGGGGGGGVGVILVVGNLTNAGMLLSPDVNQTPVQ